MILVIDTDLLLWWSWAFFSFSGIGGQRISATLVVHIEARLHLHA